MKRALRRCGGWWIALAALVAGAAAQEPDVASGPAVQLPPMIVEDSAKLPPWLYARVDGAEFLSRCSTRTTRGYVETRQARLQLLEWLVPREFFLQLDVPGITVLYSQKLRSGAQEKMIEEVLRTRSRNRGGNSDVGALPNMMLDDRDATGVFAYIDEEEFESKGLTVATDYVHFLLERRTPRLPEWLREGITTIYSQSTLEKRIVIDPLLWVSPMETSALRAESGRPRALLAASDFFSAATWREEAGRSLRGRTLRAQSALFVRWALEPRHGMREAFWRFAARAAEEPVSEAMFEACFGFGFSDWRDRLSDYLPVAVSERLTLTPPDFPRAARVAIRPATASEIARLRGEWERLSIALVRRRYPEFGDHYVGQARRTLQRAHDSGDRDARLFALLGLCEVDAGNDAGAREFLERAVAERVVRPRAYYELARLRLAELTREGGAAREFEAEEIAPVLEPLRRGLAQAPPMADAFALLADVWARCGTAPPERDWALLAAGARHQAHDPRVAGRIAAAFGRHGKTAEAVALLGKAFEHATDDATRRKLAELYATLGEARK